MACTQESGIRPASEGAVPEGRLRIEARRRRGAAIRARRKRLELTQIELAFAAQCLDSQVSRAERGRAGVADALVARMEAALAFFEGGAAPSCACCAGESAA